uniref:3'-5' exonuclease domain-containing protein n=1 Tax=Chromera velia CCMP2878 TaxID=1169474 RepID=A0A0G4HCJ9_9ALVE|mmetsp:Transcript_33792/g.66913  ORF Transcript_33792/g.66913 Transcript_33792/m.66913 type:complete len:516 (+) Transcript_33792:469-2016(+)|eukprot:Cvel_26204.t1-p1 / transcript=Cvel_26204.t1 / gene=Cvel_26204 / organism=Chromera_velia_CCMP2878 / gene_product=hypothetical protein / transcript_product=hypothetical protein / location=Cvel_scaffold3085:5042-7310(+) / protein_length=515 / sequence_SO=supercontig / SO=protein_coding / is_pseudo=false
MTEEESEERRRRVEADRKRREEAVNTVAGLHESVRGEPWLQQPACSVCLKHEEELKELFGSFEGANMDTQVLAAGEIGCATLLRRLVEPILQGAPKKNGSTVRKRVAACVGKLGLSGSDLLSLCPDYAAEMEERTANAIVNMEVRGNYPELVDLVSGRPYYVAACGNLLLTGRQPQFVGAAMMLDLLPSSLPSDTPLAVRRAVDRLRRREGEIREGAREMMARLDGKTLDRMAKRKSLERRPVPRGYLSLQRSFNWGGMPKITWVSDSASFERLEDFLSSLPASALVGVDMEWAPRMMHFELQAAELLQLAVLDVRRVASEGLSLPLSPDVLWSLSSPRIFLVDLVGVGEGGRAMRQGVSRLLANRQPPIVALGMADDFDAFIERVHLSDDGGQDAPSECRVISLPRLVAPALRRQPEGESPKGLSDICEAVLGVPLFKGEGCGQKSNWQLPPLREYQREYAATDAAATVLCAAVAMSALGFQSVAQVPGEMWESVRRPPDGERQLPGLMSGLPI